jgi:hypothetical protein
VNQEMDVCGVALQHTNKGTSLDAEYNGHLVLWEISVAKG